MDSKIILIRLAIALVLGGLIGFEREKRGQSAGLRTHILVSLGSALVMLIYLGFSHLNQFEPGRVMAGVITGIGFLGAGAIIKSKEHAKGLTTAASIWICAAIGLASGCGFLNLALIATLLTLTTLILLRVIKR